MPVTLYLGAPACGKTTLMRSHVAALIEAHPDLVFLIVNHGERPDRPTWRDLPCDYQVYRTVADWWRAPSRVAIFEGEDPVAVAQLAIDAGWSVYADDECDGILQESWKTSPLREIVKRGRHLPNRANDVTEVYALLATHRPVNLPTDISGLFDSVYVGRLYAYNDAERVRREGWINGRNVEDAQATLNALTPGQFHLWQG